MSVLARNILYRNQIQKRDFLRNKSLQFTHVAFHVHIHIKAMFRGTKTRFELHVEYICG